MTKKFRTILIDPPWPMMKPGSYAGTGREKIDRDLRYPTMALDAIRRLPINDLAETGAHLWLWTVNQFLEEALALVPHWGFKRLNMITWAKPSGYGNWWLQHTEFLIFAYKDRCQFNNKRYIPNYYEWDDEDAESKPDLEPTDLCFKWPRAKQWQHSKKPEGSYRLIEEVSDPARLEMFARNHQPLLGNRPGWSVWGNEVASDVQIALT